MQETLQKLIQAGWEAEIVLGSDDWGKVDKAVSEFRHNFSELASGIESYFQQRRDQVLSFG